MTSDSKIEIYLKKHPKWVELLTDLRKILLQSEMEEDVKWGAPVYMLNGKNIVGMAAFKNHVALWFHQGVFLKDEDQKLISAKGEDTRALRQWRFTSVDDVDAERIDSYIQEAIKNEKAGKRIKPEIKETEIPDELKIAFQKDQSLKSDYESLTPGRRREYCMYIAEAKLVKTRLSRLEKSIPLIKSRKGLYEKYKK